MNLQTDIFGRYFELTDHFTDGHNPSVLYSACQKDWRIYRQISSVGIPIIYRQLYRRFLFIGMSHTITDGLKSVGIFQAGNFFFGAQCSSVKLSQMFFFPTDIATKSGIIDEKKVDGRIPSGRTSVNILPTKP